MRRQEKKAASVQTLSVFLKTNERLSVLSVNMVKKEEEEEEEGEKKHGLLYKKK